MSDALDSQAPAATEASPAAGAAAAAGPSWFDQLPDNIRADESVAKFRGSKLEDFVAAYTNAVKLIGAPPEQVVRLDKADRAEVLRRLGAPESPDKYDIKPPEGVPAEVALGEALPWYKEVAAKAGLLPEQAQAIYEAYIGRVMEVQQQAQQAVKEAETSLRMEWGPAYETNIQAARQAVQALGIQQEVADAGLGANPAFIQALAKVGKAMFRPEEGPSGGIAPLAPADAKAEGRRLIEQAMRAFNEGRVEESRALQKRASEFFKMLG